MGYGHGETHVLTFNHRSNKTPDSWPTVSIVNAALRCSFVTSIAGSRPRHASGRLRNGRDRRRSAICKLTKTEETGTRQFRRDSILNREAVCGRPSSLSESGRGATRFRKVFHGCNSDGVILVKLNRSRGYSDGNGYSPWLAIKYQRPCLSSYANCVSMPAIPLFPAECLPILGAEIIIARPLRVDAFRPTVSLR